MGLVLLPCENAVKQFLPVMRIGIARELNDKYDVDQTTISKKLGVTQAAVSKYLSGQGRTKEVRELLKNPVLDAQSKKIAREIAENKIAQIQLQSMLCEVCESFLTQNCTIKNAF